MTALAAFAVIATSFAASALSLKLFIPLLRGWRFFDLPNERSSHSAPIPRGGGMGILLGLALGLALSPRLGIRLGCADLLTGSILIALIGLWDDWRNGIPVFIRFSMQIAAASIIVYSRGGLAKFPFPWPMDVRLGPLAMPAAVVWIVGTSNFYNFLDGIDGFAGTQGVIAGLAIALSNQGQAVSAIGLAIAGACAGFLIHNWRPARVFMGDVGSLTLGYLFACIPFLSRPPARNESLFAVSLFLWFFLSDGAYTMFRRIYRGENVWAAHHSHLYQKLLAAGLRHDQIVAKVGMASGLLAVIAVIAERAGNLYIDWVALASAIMGFYAYRRWVLKLDKDKSSSYLLDMAP